jgi:hypothetical protein
VLGERNPTKLIGAIGVLGFLVPAMGTVLWAPTWDFPGTGSSGQSIAAYVVEHRDALRAPRCYQTEPDPPRTGPTQPDEAGIRIPLNQGSKRQKCQHDAGWSSGSSRGS